MNKVKMLWKIFISTLYLSAFTFGGGYVIVTLMKKKFVDEYKWIEQEEMLDLIAIAQSSPGAIAVNGAIVIGYKLAGYLGILVSIIGTVLPPFCVICVVSFFYNLFKTNIIIKLLLDGMQSGVAAVICAVVYDMGKLIVREKNPGLIVIMILSFICGYFMNVNVIYIVFVCALIGVFQAIFKKGKV